MPLTFVANGTSYGSVHLNASLCSAAVCVLEKMLLLDPESRASASEALELPFFSEFRDVEEETEAPPYDQTIDNTDLPLDQWKRETGVVYANHAYAFCPNEPNYKVLTFSLCTQAILSQRSLPSGRPGTQRNRLSESSHISRY